MDIRILTEYRILIPILVFCILISGCIKEKANVEVGSIAKVYVIKDNATEGSIEYFSSDSRKYPFENETFGMKVGDKKKINYNEPVTVKLIHEPKENVVYTTFQSEIKIFNVTDTLFFTGHKFAGEVLKFNIKIKNVSDPMYEREICLSKYGVSEDTIVFYYSTGCKWCEKMKPWVEEIEKGSYKFLWIEVTEVGKKIEIAQECLSDILYFSKGAGVPQFGCPANGKLYPEAFRTIDEMKNFVDECKKSSEARQNTYQNCSIETNIKNGSLVEVEYVGELIKGDKVDSGITKFVVGSGKMVKGFEEAIIGMKIDESKNVTIPPEKAYGFPEAKPRTIQQDITIKSFKQVFNEEPVLNKEYTNQLVAPWPIKVVEIKTEKHNYTIEILDILTK